MCDVPVCQLATGGGVMQAGGKARLGNGYNQKAPLHRVMEDTHSFYICLYLHFKVTLPGHLGMKQKKKGMLEEAGGRLQLEF